MMSLQFKTLLMVLKHSVFGKQCSFTTENVDELYNLAVEQGVFSLVYPVVSEKVHKQNLKWEALFLKTIAVNEKKMYCLKSVMESLENAGVECCVLKGISVADVYFMPECRVSGDIDLYVNIKDEKAAMNILSKMGMEISPRRGESHHFAARDISGGLIEVHTALYNKMLGDIVLDNKFTVSEPFIKKQTQNGIVINSLGIEDNLNFLTAHLIKHFVKEGCGIRQITDLLAYINTYKKEIDFDKYFSLLREIKFETFIKNVLGIGVKYFDLEFDNYETDLSDKILEDVENGGNFGFGEKERRGFYEKFLRIRSGIEIDEFKENLSKKQRKNIFRNVFFPYKAFLIKKGYTYLKKSMILYPVAYIHRLFDLTKLLLFGKKRISQLKYVEKSNEIIDNRINLMREMEII